MRTDPTDTGGLFSGRRPGTAPVRYRDQPQRAGTRRQRTDGVAATAIAALMIVINLAFWGPIPAAGLWLGSQASYHSHDNLFLGILVAFFSILAALMLGLVVLKRLDGAWVIVRRAAGYDQKQGIIGPIFAVCAAVGATLFTIWLIFIGGLGASLAPTG